MRAKEKVKHALGDDLGVDHSAGWNVLSFAVLFGCYNKIESGKKKHLLAFKINLAKLTGEYMYHKT